MDDDRKVLCDYFRCNWHGYESQVLKATNPFDHLDILYCCPECGEINSIVYACDEEGCWKAASCGTPTDNGYRQVCGEHYRQIEKEKGDKT